MSVAVDLLKISSQAILLSGGFLANAPLALRGGLIAASHSIPGPSTQVTSLIETIRTTKGEWKQPLMHITVTMCLTLILATLVAIAFDLMEQQSTSTLFSEDEFSTPAMMPVLVGCAALSGILLAYGKKYAGTSPAWIEHTGAVLCDVVVIIPLVGMGLAAGRKFVDQTRGTKEITENVGTLLVGSGVFAATFMAGMTFF